MEASCPTSQHLLHCFGQASTHSLYLTEKNRVKTLWFNLKLFFKEQQTIDILQPLFEDEGRGLITYWAQKEGLTYLLSIINCPTFLRLGVWTYKAGSKQTGYSSRQRLVWQTVTHPLWLVTDWNDMTNVCGQVWLNISIWNECHAG